MPVMVLYRDKSISDAVCDDISHKVAELTDTLLQEKIEVRVVDTTYTYNANELHLEMRFRDFGEWSDKQLEDYHSQVMESLGTCLKNRKVSCGYSFYIIPSNPPRSLWQQDKS